MKIEQAVILCGGRGTRLNALHPNLPKALAPVAGRPFLQWQLDWLSCGGLRAVHLAAGHLAGQLAEWIRTVPQPELCLTLAREPAALGTGGGLKFSEPFLRGDAWWVLNGDSLLPNLNFQALEKTAREFSSDWKNAAAAPPALIIVTRIDEAGRYGTVEFEPDGRVTAFREKAARDAGWVNAGVYLLHRAHLAALEPGTAVSLETEFFPGLAQRGMLRAVAGPPPLLDMGTPDGLLAMERFLRAAPPAR